MPLKAFREREDHHEQEKERTAGHAYA